MFVQAEADTVSTEETKVHVRTTNKIAVHKRAERVDSLPPLSLIRLLSSERYKALAVSKNDEQALGSSEVFEPERFKPEGFDAS